MSRNSSTVWTDIKPLLRNNIQQINYISLTAKVQKHHYWTWFLYHRDCNNNKIIFKTLEWTSRVIFCTKNMVCSALKRHKILVSTACGWVFTDFNQPNRRTAMTCVSFTQFKREKSRGSQPFGLCPLYSFKCVLNS